MTTNLNQKKARPTLIGVICLVGCALAAMTIVAGVAWSVFGNARSLYTPEQAKEYEAAQVAVHAATLGHVDGGASSPGEAPASSKSEDREAAVAAAQARFRRAQTALESARFAQYALGKWLIGIGLAALVAFGVGYLTARGSSA